MKVTLQEMERTRKALNRMFSGSYPKVPMIEGEPGHSWIPGGMGSPGQPRYQLSNGLTYCCRIHSEGARC